MGILIFVLRVAIGALLLVAGILKAHDGFRVTAEAIVGYRLLPSFAIIPLAVFLPYFEIGLGCYLLLGLFTRAVASIAAVQFVIFTFAVGTVVARHIPISCGCFGSGDTAPATWLDVVRDGALVLVAALVAWKAPGSLAIDNRLRTGSHLAVPEGSSPS
ncbi:MAG TPA: MauE/DoxX family redox-associated membrane protein [Candidatus Acidoferrales bacterium]|nr:MauE/DoxX family redox-associated membrane protein [Candidatus Acidoferrales bacterium]